MTHAPEMKLHLTLQGARKAILNGIPAGDMVDELEMLVTALERLKKEDPEAFAKQRDKFNETFAAIMPQERISPNDQ